MSVSNAPHPALRPDDILDAAIAEFLSRGYADTEMHHIAGRMQVPVGAVALYFETPQDMLEALVSQTSAKLPRPQNALPRAMQKKILKAVSARSFG